MAGAPGAGRCPARGQEKARQCRAFSESQERDQDRCSLISLVISNIET